MINFKWIDGKVKLHEEEVGDVHLSPADGEHVAIERKRHTEAMEAVGVWQDVANTKNAQLEHLITKIHSIHEMMESRPLTRDLAWTGLRQAIWKSIEYVLPAMSLYCAEGD